MKKNAVYKILISKIEAKSVDTKQENQLKLIKINKIDQICDVTYIACSLMNKCMNQHLGITY